ncbi:glycosyltransferase [Psychroflexus sp. MES1-P1E]|uniref:glycosyltransferase n=1 Tax=Psychroflexus sp. MES1-P1E TaxID=2058320 RepID=UPI000C7D02CF|nr:glycosyltransferase [Psychroflexus sp. MES1-P1E]PKG43425.1 galactosyltransferase [Psychroflexus sp. MES1-P1E]
MYKKKIAFLIPSLHPGGMERVMSEIMDYCATEANIEIHLVLFGLKRDVFYEIPANTIVHRPNFQFDNRKRFINTLKTILFIRKKIKAIHPNTILSYGELWNNLVLIALLNTKYPVFVSDRCQPNKSLGKVHDFLRKKLYKNAKGIIAQTSIAKSIYESGFVKNTNITVIGNPIKQQASVNSPREKIVLSVGRLIESKHHNELIKLFAKINNPDWKLVIVGGDALHQNNSEKLEKLVQSLNVKDKVILAGNQKDVASFYKKSSIFAFTSSSEGFPNVIGEALSFGLPVVAFDCIAGPSDMIVEGENGYLIDLFDYENFKLKLENLMNDNSNIQRMSKLAPISVKKFEKNTIANTYLKFITSN